MKNQRAFSEFQESDVNFGPTYKFKPGTNILNHLKEMPAWCDRILFKCSEGLTVKQTLYDSLADVIFSDHKPVIGILELTQLNIYYYY